MNVAVSGCASLVVGDLLVERGADPLRDAAVEVGLREQRVHDHAGVVNHAVAEDLDEARLRVDLDNAARRRRSARRGRR